MNCILIKQLEEFISSLIKPFIGNWVTSGIRVFRTLKKKVNFVFYYIASTKRAMPVILRSLIVCLFLSLVCDCLFVVLLKPFSQLFLSSDHSCIR